MKYPILALLLLIGSSALATIPDSLKRRVDSLKSLLNSSDIEKRYAAEFGIAWELFDVDNQLAANHARLAFGSALSIGDTSVILRTGRIYGQLLRRVDQLDSAVRVLMSVIPLADKTADKAELSKVYNALGVLYNVKGRIDQSLLYHLKAMRIRKHLQDSALIGASLQNIGVAYYKMSNTEQADRYYNEALKYPDHFGRSLLLLNIATLRIDQGRLSSVEALIQEALKIAQPGNYLDNQIQYNYAYGWYHRKQGKFDSAILFYRNSMSAASSLSDTRMQIDGFLGIARCYEAMRDYGAALSTLYNVGTMVNDGNHDRERLEYYDVMSEVLEGNSSYKEALVYRNRHKRLNDSLFHQTVANNALVARLEFEEEQNEITIARQSEMIALRETMINRRNLLLILTGILALVLIAMAVILYRFNRYQQKISVELDHKVLDRTRELQFTEGQLTKRLNEQRILQGLISNKICASVATIRGLWSIAMDGSYDKDTMWAQFDKTTADLLQVSQVVDKTKEGSACAGEPRRSF